ncbi:MAG TPA: acyltransferase [Caulobacteraceae bacterium]|nr:acyltransferase [Caulobacteraceae bacterium]
MKTWASIQHLRAAAAIAVAVYHACQWLGGGFQVGRAGVDVFFVISGFIMWSITAGDETPRAPPAKVDTGLAIGRRSDSKVRAFLSRSGRFDLTGEGSRPLTFLRRRITRVAPGYWAATLIMAAIAIAWPAFLPQIRAGWSHVLLSMAFVPHLDPLGQPFPMLPAGWTLNYEAVFYGLFALALMLPERTRLGTMTAALFAIGVFGYVDRATYAMGANFMMAEFALGLWIGRLVQTGFLVGPRLGAAFVAAALAAFAVTNTAGWADSFFRPLVWGAPSALLVAGALALEQRGLVLAWPPLKALGDASYAIYLAHMAAVALVFHLVGIAQPALFLALALAATVAAGWLFHVGVERPLTRLSREVLATPAPAH